jgi:hypothetical protein
MIWTIAIIFALVWALGLTTELMLGGLIHILLAVSVGLFLFGAYRAGRNKQRNAKTPGSPSKAPPKATATVNSHK